MGELVSIAPLHRASAAVTTADNDEGAPGLGLSAGIEHRACAGLELLPLVNASWTVPDDGLSPLDSLLVVGDSLGTNIETHPAVWDALFLSEDLDLAVLVELVTADEVLAKVDLDVLRLGLFEELLDDLGALFVEPGAADLDVIADLEESEGHGTADDHLIDLVEEVVDQFDLICNLGATEDGEKWPLRGLDDWDEGIEFHLDKVTSSPDWELDTDHGSVSPVSCAEGIVDVDITIAGEGLGELLDSSWVGLDLLAIGVNTAALFLDVEPDVLEEDDGALGWVLDGGINLWANALWDEGDWLADELLKALSNWPQGGLRVHTAVRAAKVGEEDDRLGALLEDFVDGWDRSGDPLVVGDLAISAERNVEVNTHHNALSSELFLGEIVECQLVAEHIKK